MNITRASLFPGLDGFAQSLTQLLAINPPDWDGERFTRAWRNMVTREQQQPQSQP